MSHQEIINVVAAHQEGKQIQTRSHFHPTENWQNCNPVWDFYQNDYRVAPEPRRPREWTVVVTPDSVITSHNPMESVKAFSWEMIRVREVID